MIESIISEFKVILGEIDWMDGESKAKAYDKVIALFYSTGSFIVSYNAVLIFILPRSMPLIQKLDIQIL